MAAAGTIRGGRIVAKKKTIQDVARAAGVSKATVSNFLNDRHAHFSSATAARIRKAVSSLRYIPDPGARGIKSQEGGKSLGIVIRNSLDHAVTTAYFQQVVPAIADALSAHGYRALVIPETRDRQRDLTYIRELSKGLIAGYFLFDIETDDPYVEALELDGVKFVCIGYNRQVRNFVASRHDLGMEAAVAHLSEAHGSRRIAVLAGDLSQTIARDRVKGYRAGLVSRRLRWSERLVLPRRRGEEAGGDILRLGDLLASNPRPDALLLPYRKLHEVETLLEERGLRVPEDIRLVLFDTPGGMQGGRHSHIKTRVPQIGKTAADKMLLLLKNNPEGQGGVFLDVDFVPGQSCGC